MRAAIAETQRQTKAQYESMMEAAGREQSLRLGQILVEKDEYYGRLRTEQEKRHEEHMKAINAEGGTIVQEYERRFKELEEQRAQREAQRDREMADFQTRMEGEANVELIREKVEAEMNERRASQVR